MYTKFFDLKEKPFEITPDPRFLFLSDHHKEALAHLIYAAKEGKGFTMISGEVGTGKTLMGQTLLHRLDEKTKTISLVNPTLTPLEFLHYICEALGLKDEQRTRGQYIAQIHAHLLEMNARGEKVILVIDEAQSLSPAILEEIRLLTNLETDKSKLFLVVLLGQPELNHLLDGHEFRPLKQRLILRYHILPLNKKEVGKYIEKRLMVAGTPNPNIFTPKAIKRIYDYSQGIPRLINIVCDNAMLTGFSTDQKIIREKIIQEVIRKLDGPKRPKEKKMGLWLLFTAIGSFLLGSLLVSWKFGLLDQLIEFIEKGFYFLTTKIIHLLSSWGNT
jgi:general secretion pathway protein A